MQLQSDNINEIAIALAKVQAQLSFATKDSSNPFFKSKYADLAEVWSTCQPLLANNEIAVVQQMRTIEAPFEEKEFDRDGKIKSEIRGSIKNLLVTTLIHSSGQWLKSEVELKLTKNDPQGLGSAITYMRRYSLCAMVGVIQSDDDGEAACNNKKSGTHNYTPSEMSVKAPQLPKIISEKEAEALQAMHDMCSAENQVIMNDWLTKNKINSYQNLSVNSLKRITENLNAMLGKTGTGES